MNFKKNTILALFGMVMMGSQAHAWNEIVNCNNGDLVIDQGDNDSMGRPTYQMVLRGEPLHYFVHSGAIEASDINRKGEFIMWLNTYDSQWMGYKSFQSEIGQPFKYRYYWVGRSYDKVYLRATIGNRLQGEGEKANWTFHDCR